MDTGPLEESDRHDELLALLRRYTWRYTGEGGTHDTIKETLIQSRYRHSC